MKKSLFLSALLHLVLITIFLFLPLAVDLSKKNKAIALTVGPPDATSQKTASEEKESEPSEKPDNEKTQAPEKPKSEVSDLPAELPADITPPVQSSASTPAVPMQTSANTQPEASPEVYGSMGLDSYYYNKPMEAYSPLPTAKSPAKKPQQQYAMKSSIPNSPKIPMQKSSMILTQSVPTITVSIIKNMNAETTPLETQPNTVESTYVQSIQQTIEQSKSYPEEGQAGTVKIKFRVTKDGTLIKTEIIEPSGSEVLDAAGAVLLKKIGKFQPIPDILKKEFMDIILNIHYQ